jgi:hypothetical protein
MCFASIQKLTKQTFRNSGALVFLCTGATTSPKDFSFVVVYHFLIGFNMYRKLSM